MCRDNQKAERELFWGVYWRDLLPRNLPVRSSNIILRMRYWFDFEILICPSPFPNRHGHRPIAIVIMISKLQLWGMVRVHSYFRVPHLRAPHGWRRRFGTRVWHHTRPVHWFVHFIRDFLRSYEPMRLTFPREPVEQIECGCAGLLFDVFVL